MSNKQGKKLTWLSLESVVVICSAVFTLSLMYSEHTKSMENIQRTTALLEKYEQQLDLAISSDKNVLKTYKTNMQKALSSLSRQEKALLKQVLAINTNNTAGK